MKIKVFLILLLIPFFANSQINVKELIQEHEPFIQIEEVTFTGYVIKYLTTDSLPVLFVNYDNNKSIAPSLLGAAIVFIQYDDDLREISRYNYDKNGNLENVNGVAYSLVKYDPDDNSKVRSHYDKDGQLKFRGPWNPTIHEIQHRIIDL